MPFPLSMGNGEEEIEKMNYAMVNSDEITTVEQLEKYTGEIRWSYLKPHFEAGSLIWVSPELELTTVGQAMAEDESESVQAWKKKGLVLIPSDPHADYWESIDAAFRALVVSPFVLVQPLEEAES